jgi:hypothetical protein
VHAIEGVEMVVMSTILACSCLCAQNHYPIENQPTRIHIVILYSGPQEFLQNKFVQMPIHPTFNFVSCSRPNSRHASPNHQWPTGMLQNLMDILRSNMSFTFNPTSWPTIWVKPIYLCLVIKNHSFSIINGPILIPLSKTLGMRELGNNSKMVSFATLVNPIQRLSKHASQVVLGNNLHVSKWTCYIIANAIPSQTSITRVT